MKIGVVSDTHNNLKNVSRLVELFNEHEVEVVIHTGDVTQAKTLELFCDLNAKLIGVFGNNDQERESLGKVIDSHGFEFHEPPLRLTLANRELLVVHDPRDLAESLTSECDLALHGHTHLLEMKTENGTLIFNPGECAGHLEGHNAIGIVDLKPLKASLIRF